MHVDYDTNPGSTKEMCEVLESLCEGFVQAHVAEIGKDPDAFPCCVKCGKFVCVADGSFFPGATGLSTPKNVHKQPGRNYFRNHQGWPGSEIAATVAQRNHQGWPGSEIAATVANPTKVQCQNPSGLNEKGSGTPVDLAVFQCAQERRRGKDCSVEIFADAHRRLHAVVAYSDGTIKDPRDDAVSQADCGCGVPGA